MGAWGCGPADNDSGADFIDDLREASGTEVVDLLNWRLMQLAKSEDAISVRVGEELCAAGFFLSQLDTPLSDTNLVRQVVAAMHLVLNSDHSELRQVWREAGGDEYEQWYECTSHLAQTLEAVYLLGDGR